MEENDQTEQAGVEATTTGEINASHEVPQNIMEDKQWLRFHHEPLEDVKNKWESTINLRRKEIEQTTSTTDQTYLSVVFLDWPLYKQSFGHILVS